MPKKSFLKNLKYLLECPYPCHKTILNKKGQTAVQYLFTVTVSIFPSTCIEFAYRAANISCPWQVALHRLQNIGSAR